MEPMSWIGRGLREPLVHFLALGCAIFILFDIVNGGGTEESKTIRVARDEVVTFLQYRQKAFDAGRADAAFNALNPVARQALIDDFVRTEALVREAKALGLDETDFVARQRLVQQIEYLTKGFASGPETLSDAAVAEYYAAHKDDYAENAKVTFTHVFVDNRTRGAEAAHRLAEAKLQDLNDQKVPFRNAPAYTDRFLYHVNYVQKGKKDIASHFGDAMAQSVFALTPDATRWQGPFRSDYGSHLVMVTEHRPARIPPLADIRQRVLTDAVEARRKGAFDEAISDIVSAYDVVLSPDLAGDP